MDRQRRVFACVCLGCGALLGAGCPGILPVIYDQGAYGWQGGYSELNELDPLLGGGFQQLAEDFVLGPEGRTVAAIRWWGAYRLAMASPDDFTVRLFAADEHGLPKTTPMYEFHVGAPDRVDTGDFFEPNGWRLPIYRYTASVRPVTLEPGATYFVSVLNDVGCWMWSNNGDPAEGDDFGCARTAIDAAWTTHGVDQAFELRGGR